MTNEKHPIEWETETSYELKEQLKTVVELKNNSLEGIAKKVFDLDKVLTKIKELSAKGFCHYCVTTNDPIDLTKTLIAMETTAKLRIMGFQVEVEEREINQREKRNLSNTELKIKLFVISW